MIKKLVYINSIVLLLTTVVYVLGYYLMNYPMTFSFFYLIKECRLEYLALILSITALISYLISSLTIKKSNYRTNFLQVFPLINILAVLFLTYHSTKAFLETRKQISKMEKSYLQQAEKDIKNDKIIIRYAGGLSISPSNQKTIKSMDSIRKKYGVTYVNTGCTIDFAEIKAQEKYSEAVTSYLEKRNGKGWEKKMTKEISLLTSEK
ncbi:hypothetical protein [Chryseobacterium arthrosphaerae]|uniref:FEKKY domain-containing protein n=1 Tax=Chryseobacterium arthrosphaerae TaxID=651561 RepID=UPI001F4B80AA|nr:hypothetical protein [Chryseobacterium arthrosphaerae]MDG4653844.1 hypothetical protein [Chryseobacterium arthrosphaerae]